VLLAALAPALGTFAGLIALAVAAGSTASYAPAGADPPPTALAQIPNEYLRLYETSAQRYGLDWAILAGIGRVECDHGRDPDPACTREGAVNRAGAGGPMQFLAATWARYGVDGDGDGRVDRWDPADAIYAAASYLRAAGAPRDYRTAIYAYNHAGSYVQEVLHWAAVYRDAARRALGGELAGAASEGGPQIDGHAPTDREGAAGAGEATALSPTPIRLVAGERAVLSPDDGHLALIPAQAPPAVQAMVIAGNELQQLPYGPDGHPDPRGAADEDCSSTVNYVLYRAGVRPIAEILSRNPLARDYLDWGAPGPGRWVSTYATAAPSDHVFIVIAGLRLDTSHDGTDVGPNRAEGGPRWRILDRIPTWAHWTVRHPPGL
jgi:hypothetical protein